MPKEGAGPLRRRRPMAKEISIRPNKILRPSFQVVQLPPYPPIFEAQQPPRHSTSLLSSESSPGGRPRTEQFALVSKEKVRGPFLDPRMSHKPSRRKSRAILTVVCDRGQQQIGENVSFESSNRGACHLY